MPDNRTTMYSWAQPEEHAANSAAPASLVVFSDDWGRHPSSCQHLMRQLLPRYKVLWVNTIGTRAPRINLDTLRRAGEKIRQWTSQSQQTDRDIQTDHYPENLTVTNPRMWPWFTRSLDRRLNASLLTRQLTRQITKLPQPIVAVTTLPITADLPDRLPVKSWLYYCVDDFAEWPGLDGNTLRRMDCTMAQRADSIVCVSRHLQEHYRNLGRDSSLLTHGVDLDHWRCEKTNLKLCTADGEDLTESHEPLIVFWGVVDRRLDSSMVTRLASQIGKGNIVLVGPAQEPDPAILRLPNVHAIGALPFESLPAVAQRADVLVMPYADLPVTRAMQPLKMKEYLATAKPVVVSDLPAARPWADCMDIARTPDQFSRIVVQRIRSGVPAEQGHARDRLANESWKTKAGQLEALIHQCQPTELKTEPSEEYVSAC